MWWTIANEACITSQPLSQSFKKENSNNWREEKHVNMAQWWYWPSAVGVILHGPWLLVFVAQRNLENSKNKATTTDKQTSNNTRVIVWTRDLYGIFLFRCLPLPPPLVGYYFSCGCFHKENCRQQSGMNIFPHYNQNISIFLIKILQLENPRSLFLLWLWPVSVATWMKAWKCERENVFNCYPSLGGESFSFKVQLCTLIVSIPPSLLSYSYIWLEQHKNVL